MADKRASQVIVGTVSSAGVPAKAAIGSGAFTSAVASIGEATNVALMVQTDAAVTFIIQASDDFKPGAGRNQLDSTNTIWYDYIRADAYESASGVEGNETKIVFAGAAQVAIDMSPFAPKYLRITTAAGGSANVFAAVVTSG